MLNSIENHSAYSLGTSKFSMKFSMLMRLVFRSENISTLPLKISSIITLGTFSAIFEIFSLATFLYNFIGNPSEVFRQSLQKFLKHFFSFLFFLFFFLFFLFYFFYFSSNSYKNSFGHSFGNASDNLFDNDSGNSRKLLWKCLLQLLLHFFLVLRI